MAKAIMNAHIVYMNMTRYAPMAGSAAFTAVSDRPRKAASASLLRTKPPLASGPRKWRRIGVETAEAKFIAPPTKKRAVATPMRLRQRTAGFLSARLLSFSCEALSDESFEDDMAGAREMSE
ncbi:MAG: hypothetical protein E6K01_05200 [Methanobacteriota archaeon]|nr:MAG: hypothetical protein E6K01_05200 [Euryarchaeota archaeon]